MPRKTALHILNKIDKHRFTLDKIIEDEVNKKDLFSKQDRGLFNVIVYGVLRWKKSIDFIIEEFSNISLDDIEPEILNILRIGIFQLRFLDRIPESAAVNTSVELTKPYENIWMTKFVNAILRNSTRNRDIPLMPNRNDNIIRYISIMKSFPEWLIKRWVKLFGTDETENLCDALNQIPPITIRVNTLKTDRETLIESLKLSTRDIHATKISPYGISFNKPVTSINKLVEYEQGLCRVQDEAAQLTAMLLDPKPGEKVLDAFAGLGGKTGHIAQLMNNQGEIIAADHDEKKLLRLKEDMKRLGISNVTTITHDFSTQGDFLENQKFDKILIDAPCSGLGVIRRNPDTKWSASEEDLKKKGERQIALLDNIAAYVKVSGIILYTVCSLEPEENENVLNVFLSRHPEFCINELECDQGWLSQLSFCNKKYFKTLTHLDNTDGFFCACLKRKK